MEQTIAAISTSTMSSGGISIVRISGENAISVADTIFEAKNNKKNSNNGMGISVSFVENDEIIEYQVIRLYK